MSHYQLGEGYADVTSPNYGSLAEWRRSLNKDPQVQNIWNSNTSFSESDDRQNKANIPEYNNLPFSMELLAELNPATSAILMARDAQRAAEDFNKGDYGWAALNALSVIPFVGPLISKFNKFKYRRPDLDTNALRGANGPSINRWQNRGKMTDHEKAELYAMQGKPSEKGIMGSATTGQHDSITANPGYDSYMQRNNPVSFGDTFSTTPADLNNIDNIVEALDTVDNFDTNLKVSPNLIDEATEVWLNKKYEKITSSMIEKADEMLAVLEDQTSYHFRLSESTKNTTAQVSEEFMERIRKSDSRKYIEIVEERVRNYSKMFHGL